MEEQNSIMMEKVTDYEADVNYLDRLTVKLYVGDRRKDIPILRHPAQIYTTSNEQDDSEYKLDH